MPEITYSAYRNLNRQHDAPCHGDAFAMIEGDRIGVICRSPGEWRLVRATEQHKASAAILRKNALAIVLSGYTNRKEP